MSSTSAAFHADKFIMSTAGSLGVVRGGMNWELALKAEEGEDLHVIGSPGLLQTLMALGLVDELQLMIDPLAVGGGKRLFRDDGALRPLRLADSQVTSTGAIIATYAAAGG